MTDNNNQHNNQQQELTAKALHTQAVDWFYHVQQLSNMEFQALVILLNDDLNDDNILVRDQVQDTLWLVKYNRMNS